MYNVLPQSTKGMRKWDEKLDSLAAKKGAKKQVSSDCPKCQKKKVAIKIRETCEKTMFAPSNPIKATNLSLLLSDRMLPN
jgi:hypothetical protein